MKTSVAPLRLRGIDHIAIGTDDMAASLRFYVGVLGFRIINAMRTPPGTDSDTDLVSLDERDSRSDFRRPPGAPPFTGIRHYNLSIGNDTLLGLFEYPKGTPAADRDTIGGLQHIAFHAEKSEFLRVAAVLSAAGVEFLGPFCLPDGHTTINVFDPNGVRLEVVTDIDRDDYSSVEFVEMSPAELREELATLLTRDEADAYISLPGSSRLTGRDAQSWP